MHGRRVKCLSPSGADKAKTADAGVAAIDFFGGCPSACERLDMNKGITVIAFLMASAIAGQAQHKAAFTYGADFHYCFDNREFDRSGNRFETSGTIHAARLTPSVGFKVSGGRMTHSLTLGIDVMKNMGEAPVSEGDRNLQNSGLFREMTFWYGLERRKGRDRFSLLAGIFPRDRSFFGSGWPARASDPVKTDPVSTLFISEANLFYDNNLEGLLLKYETGRGYCEAGLDWMGMIGSGRRERFQIFTYGNYALAGDFLRVGWAAAMYHFANTLEYRGVVDNVLVAPFVTLMFGGSGLRCSARFSYIQGVHQDRINETGLEPAAGGSLTLNVGYRKLGVLNDSYYGAGQMPYWSTIDGGGNMLGQDLYPGNPFYRINAKGERSPGFYDRAELYWQPWISDFVSLRLSAVFHFTGDGYEGCQQKLTLLFDLGRALEGKKSVKEPRGISRGQRDIEVFL